MNGLVLVRILPGEGVRGNCYLYGFSNPVKYVDPSGEKACWGQVCQTFEPYSKPYVDGTLRRYRDGTYSLEYIQFYPEVENRWFAAIQGYPGQRDSGDPCDNNACGLVSVTAILRNLFPSLKLTPKEAQDLLGVCLDTEGLYLDDRGLQTQVQQLAERLGVNIEATYGYAPSAGRALRFDDFYGDLRQGLVAGGWPIIAVGINDDTDELQADLETNKHFVVVTGLSTDAYWNRENSPDSIWRWVKLYDPWLNRTRYYPASVLFDWSFGKEYLIVKKR